MSNQTEQKGGPFIFSTALNAATQPDDTTAVSETFVSRESSLDDLIHHATLQHRAACWHKGLNADLLDSKHAAYLTTAVNETDVDHPDLNDSLPAPPAGGLNVKWQKQATQNSSDQTPVSAYVPFSSLSTATIVSTDYAVITDTSDSANPKRGLISDIVSLVPAGAPASASYVTLGTDATLTSERVLTEGLGIDFADAGAGSTLTVTLDLGEIANATPTGADKFVFVDADDSIGKLGTAAETLVALGAAASATAVTAAAVLTDNAIPVGAGGARGVETTPVTIDPATGNTSGVGTLASGAHTITQATVGTAAQTLISTATNDDPTTIHYHGRTVTTDNGVGTLFTFTPTADKHYAFKAMLTVRQTSGAGTGTGRVFEIFADVQDIGGALTVTVVSNNSGGTLAVTSGTVAVSGATVVLRCQVEALGGSGFTYVHHADITLFGPTGT